MTFHTINLDIDRLHQVIETPIEERDRRAGATTALLYQMLGCAELGEPGTRWLFITSHGEADAVRVMRMFASLLQQNGIPFTIGHPRNVIEAQEKNFHFYTVDDIERKTIGMKFEGMFDDVNDHALDYKTYQQIKFIRTFYRRVK